MCGKLALTRSSGDSTGDPGRRLHVASPARPSINRQPSERDRACEQHWCQRDPPAAVAEAEWPWLPDSGWIGGGHALGREVPGTRSLAPGLLHERARSPLACPCPQSQVASGQLWLLAGAPRDSPSLPETEMDASIAAPNHSPPPGNQLCCSEALSAHGNKSRHHQPPANSKVLLFICK